MSIPGSSQECQSIPGIPGYSDIGLASVYTTMSIPGSSQECQSIVGIPGYSDIGLASVLLCPSRDHPRSVRVSQESQDTQT